ncbi:hypothetical protein A2477_01980 [Candidatus Falkowbacteria bacterium RIFOXYC2_FULL_47_12]|uniref:YoaR-like putative peptidoglycan binding domain-containing protein n=2 Tax=Candidatus Falkowiibacteriota TaxID=1752728 RepID=A0A1F5TPT5_9BACT|nr:MAG: hypothetical protein A2242_03870 [Candidatus Falkowbacteria bacterium RIFOXYA2_FULL_47_9]OGF40814.1 MAG: hypothetical protein A2477_01980 [Candidatus Falkowbacteria bacterium RIFOXYC2_FULL_47_12]
MGKKLSAPLTNFHKKFNETKHALAKPQQLFRFFDNKFLEHSHRLLWLATFVCLGIIIFMSAIAGYEQLYADSFFPGTRLADSALGGKTYAAAQSLLAAQTDAFSHRGIAITYGDKTAIITATTIADTPDAASDIFSFNTEASLRELFFAQHNPDLWPALVAQARSAFSSTNFPLQVFVDEDKLAGLLKENFSAFENPAKNATITVDGDNVSVRPESYGKKFDYPALIAAMKSRLIFFDERPIFLSLKTDYPTAYAADIQPLLTQASAVLARAPFQLVIPPRSSINADKKFLLDKIMLAPLLTAKPDARSAGAFAVALKDEETARYLAETIAPFTDIAPTDAKFVVHSGKVSEFVSSAAGQKLNVAESIRRFEQLLQSADETATTTPTVAVVVDTLPSEVTTDSVNTLGITEIIGTGYSNFAGSPANRRHNIAVGAAAVNGTLIKPNEEFSLLKTLGTVDAAAGYLPELVIKGNETVPEYGGGLCQIGTTAFRGTLASGLPVTARQNHSYRVSYYEPAGTDATIYDPAPDFKFINDTSNYILIQSRIVGNDLYFDFWGTRDGRGVEQTKPVIYNLTAPPPTKLVETDKLAPGEKKCTEHAHNGADAYFDYAVTYSDDSKKEERFKSHYRPWQEVCLVGVEQSATSTPETLVPASF